MLQNGGRSLAALAIPWQTSTLKLTIGCNICTFIDGLVIFWSKYPKLLTTRVDRTQTLEQYK